jgi:integrase
MTPHRHEDHSTPMELSPIVMRKLSLGMSRKEARKKGRISSMGTARNYEYCYRQYCSWRFDNELHPGQQDNAAQVRLYLEECAEIYSQSALDQHRGALQLLFGLKLPRVQSTLATVLTTRAYSADSVSAILVRQSDKNAFSTVLSHQSGIRAHELITIRRDDELSASPSRNWDPRRFAGMPESQIYVVTGKGGLRREVAVPNALALELENHRRHSAKRVVDRGIYYDSYYDIGVGQAFSQSFSDASVNALGFSTGAHGLRHSYVKNRTATLEALGFSFSEAQGIVSQEVGHFRPCITLAYYR